MKILIHRFDDRQICECKWIALFLNACVRIVRSLVWERIFFVSMLSYLWCVDYVIDSRVRSKNPVPTLRDEWFMRLCLNITCYCVYQNLVYFSRGFSTQQMFSKHSFRMTICGLRNRGEMGIWIQLRSKHGGSKPHNITTRYHTRILIHALHECRTTKNRLTKLILLLSHSTPCAVP